MAQQLLALCLQEDWVGDETWSDWLGGLPLAAAAKAREIATWLVTTQHLDHDAGMLFIGPVAERRYGRRHFLELLSVFTAEPQFTVFHGRAEIGTVDPMVLTGPIDGPRLLSLAGRSWRVNHTDWRRRRAWVEPSDEHGTSRWFGIAQPLSHAVTSAMRRVLLGVGPAGVSLSRRGAARLVAIREEQADTVQVDATVVARAGSGQVRWWTWGGARANAVLAQALSEVSPGLVDETDRYDNRYLRLQ